MKEPGFDQEESISYKKIDRAESQHIAANFPPGNSEEQDYTGIAFEKWELRKELVERARSQALENIRIAIQNKLLPKHILDRVDFLENIPLNFDLDTPMYNAEFLPEEWEIDASISSDERYYAAMVHLLVHEFLHVLSGTSNITRDAQGVKNRRTGLMTHNDEKMTYSYWWLNEGVTELLARSVSGEYYKQLIGTEDGRHYQEEINLLRILLDKSNEPLREALIDAYFEDRDASALIPRSLEYSMNPQQPKMQVMMQMFNKAFGKGFLNRLDSHLKSHKGVVEMIQLLSSKDFSPDNIRMKAK